MAIYGRPILQRSQVRRDFAEVSGWSDSGRVRLVADESHACARPDAPYLGGVSPSTLARAGRVEGAPEVLRPADALFAWHAAPRCADEFERPGSLRSLRELRSR